MSGPTSKSVAPCKTCGKTSPRALEPPWETKPSIEAPVSSRKFPTPQEMAHKGYLMPWFPCLNSTPLHSLYELSAKCLEDLSRKREAAVRITLDDLRTRQGR